jgi:hypothetical protein
MAMEMAKCASSLEYFALNYCKVLQGKKGLAPLELREYQNKIMRMFKRYDRVCLLQPRQSGKTAITAVYALHTALFSTVRKSIYILSNKGDAAKDFLERIKTIYTEIPDYLKKGVLEWNKTNIQFEDKTAIYTSTTTDSAIRGRSVDLLILDEFAFVPEHIAGEFFSGAQPTVASTKGQIIIISTPKGNTGQFYDIYSGAVKGENDYAHMKVEWNEVPGRNEKFKEKMIKEIGTQKWLSEYACVSEKTLINIKDKVTGKIYKVKIGDLYEQGEKLKSKEIKNTRFEIETPEGWKDFDGIKRLPEKQQLYKITLEDKTFLECTFKHKFVIDNKEFFYKDLEIGNVVQTKKGLKKIVKLEKTDKIDWVFDVLEVKSSDHSFYSNDIVSHNCEFLGSSSSLVNGDTLGKLEKLIIPPNFEYPNLEVWEKPIENHIYVMGVDVSMGVGNDFSVMQILDITNPVLYKQVAVFSDNYIRTKDFTAKIYDLAKTYNEAFVIIENNTYGERITSDLWNEIGYEWMYYEQGKPNKGVFANKRNKIDSNSAMKRILEEDRILVRDKSTMDELYSYVELGIDKYGSDNGHDDRVDALRWICYFVQSKYWKDLEDFMRKSRNVMVGEGVVKDINQKEVFRPVIIKQDTGMKYRIDNDGLMWPDDQYF